MPQISQNRPNTIKQTFDTDMCEAPIDEEPINDSLWAKAVSRVEEEEGAVQNPNDKHSLLFTGSSRPGNRLV